MGPSHLNALTLNYVEQITPDQCALVSIPSHHIPLISLFGALAITPPSFSAFSFEPFDNAGSQMMPYPVLA